MADVYVINTCSVTDNADKECRLLVRRIQRKAPEAMVVITGCYAQLKPNGDCSHPGCGSCTGCMQKNLILRNTLKRSQKVTAPRL